MDELRGAYMKYRKFSNEYDYSFGNNEQDYISDIDAAALAIKSKILLFYGEWWEDLSIGIPMFESIVGQMNTQNLRIAVQNLIQKRILEIPQIRSIKEFDIEIKNRSLFVHIVCIYNQEEVEVEVNV